MAVAPQAFNEQVDRGTGFFVIVGKAVVTAVNHEVRTFDESRSGETSFGKPASVNLRPIDSVSISRIWLSKDKALADEVAALTGGERFGSVVTRLTNYYPIDDEHRFKMEGE